MKQIKRHIIPVLTVLLGILALNGCSDKLMLRPLPEEVDVRLRVQFDFTGIISRATDNGTPYERRVNDLRIFVFETEGRLEQMLSFDATDFEDERLETETVILAGDKIFVLIGNAPANLTTALDNVEYLSELKSMELTTDPNQYTEGLPFVTFEEVTIVKQEDDPVELTLSLRRATARTELRLIKSDDNYTTVELVSVTLLDMPTKSALLPGSPLTDLSLLTSLNDTYASVLLSKSETFTTTSRYLYEWLTGTGNAETNRATRIRLELLIDGVSNVYILPLITMNEAMQTVNDVMRNNFYQLDILVYPYSIYVDYNILNWYPGEDYEKELGSNGENGSFYTIGKWIDGTEDDDPDDWKVVLTGN